MSHAGTGPETVHPGRPRVESGAYGRNARPVLAFAESLSGRRTGDAAALARDAGRMLEEYVAALTAARVPQASILPARLALGLIVDQAARANRVVDTREWAAGAQNHVFAGQEMSLGRLRDFVDRASEAGAEFAPVHAFLADCLARAGSERTSFDAPRGGGWTGIVVTLVGGFLLLMLGWTGYVEWRFHDDLWSAAAGMEAPDEGEAGPGGLARRLDRLAEARDRISAAAAKAPVRIFAGPMGFDAAERAGAEYRRAVTDGLPPILLEAVDLSLGSEGDGLALYDTLRAWEILSGQTEWSSAYLEGWLRDRPEVLENYQRLVNHISTMTGVDGPIGLPDGELLAQARDFATDAGEAERAYLELRRSDAVAALPNWRATTAVRGIDDILVRRSGDGMAVPIDSVYTATGWAHARDTGAGLAVQRTRAEAARMLGPDLRQLNDAPDRVMALLQEDTLTVWKTYLSDLRVRPFSDRESGIFVSGRLSVRNSLLEQLLRAVWVEVGGTDRQRPHNLQLRIATEFGPMIQYVEQGRLTDISALFAALNVALGAMDEDEASGLERLMSVTDRAQSVAALRQAPSVVVQIVEDVLAQTSASHADLLTNPLTRAWQAEVLPLCRAVTEATYPFTATSADSDLAGFVRLFGPGGAGETFLRARAAPYLETAETTWRWKPEARFAGLSPETALFLQRMASVRAGFFGAEGLETAINFAALAERGTAFVSLGGEGGAVRAGRDAVELIWPGPAPERGIEAEFDTPDGPASLIVPGPWGLFRMLDGLRLRERDEGRRYLVDLRVEGARLFLELGFGRAENPISTRKLLQGLECPTVL